MDENTIKKLLAEVKNDLVAQMKDTEKSIKESVKNEIKDAEKTIRNDIDVIKNDVAANRSELEELKARVNVIEEKTKSGDTVVIDNDKKDADSEEEIVKVMSAARSRIGLKPITLDDIDRVANKVKMNGMAALREAVKEFMKDELKLDDEEIENLGEFDVYRKDSEENDKVYLKFAREESSNYISRKAALVRNENINIFPYIPPQIFQRFSDLSRLTFIARQADKRLKKKILLGKRDLVLKTKIKDSTDWVVQDDLNVFGDISDIDLNVMWPVADVKQITSPPKGRNRKNVHKLSSNSENDSPDKKKTKTSQSPKDKEDQENQKKVAEFVQNLEKKSGNKKYTQSKIKLTSVKEGTK